VDYVARATYGPSLKLTNDTLYSQQTVRRIGTVDRNVKECTTQKLRYTSVGPEIVNWLREKINDPIRAFLNIPQLSSPFVAEPLLGVD